MTLCLRAGTHCSNPACRKPTTGPTTDNSKVNNIGQAAHIAAAAPGPGAARYDPSMTPEQRRNIDNGIWLCQNCATMIDRDADRYSVSMLKDWKRQAEEAADREHGQTPIAESELALMRAAIFKTPLGRSVATAVTDFARLAGHELEKVDPRFSAEVSTLAGVTQIVFRAKEPVKFSAVVAQPHQTEFVTKMRALLEHGERLEMDASAMRLTGSALLEVVPQGFGTITFDTQMRRKAVQKILLQDPATGAVFVMDDFVGEIVGGSQSLTFEGHAFDGLYSVRYRYEYPRAQKQQNLDIHFDFSRDLWQGRTLRELPYFDKLYRYIDTLREGWRVSMTLEVEGVEVWSASTSELIAAQSLNETHLLLRYVKCARELLALWRLDVPYNDGPIRMVDVRHILELWSLQCERPKLRGQALSSGHCAVTPQNETEAAALRSTLEAGQPAAIMFGRESTGTLDLMGSYIAVNPVRLHYSQVKLETNAPLSEVRAGESMRVAVVPMQDCVFSIELSDPPCLLVSGPARDAGSASEVTATT